MLYEIEHLFDFIHFQLISLSLYDDKAVALAPPAKTGAVHAMAGKAG
jgi:hypothetical protein